MRTQPKAVRDAVLLEVGRLYRETDTPNRELARMMNVGLSRFNAIRDQQGWPLREAARSSRYRASREAGDGEGAPASASEPGESRACPSEKALGLTGAARRLRNIAVQRIALIESGAAGRERDPERDARTLASLARTLQLAQALAGPDPAPEDAFDGTEPPPRSLDELRDELRRHMLRLREGYRLRRRDRRAQPARD